MTYDEVSKIVMRKAKYMGGGLYMVEPRNKSFVARDTHILMGKVAKAFAEEANGN